MSVPRFGTPIKDIDCLSDSPPRKKHKSSKK